MRLINKWIEKNNSLLQQFLTSWSKKSGYFDIKDTTIKGPFKDDQGYLYVEQQNKIGRAHV